MLPRGAEGYRSRVHPLYGSTNGGVPPFHVDDKRSIILFQSAHTEQQIGQAVHTVGLQAQEYAENRFCHSVRTYMYIYTRLIGESR